MIRSSSLGIRYQASFSSGTHESIADVPVEKGGAGKGFGPHELLEAALATCLTMTAEMHAAKVGMPLKRTNCEVRIDRSIPNSIALRYVLYFEGPLTDVQIAELRDAANRCPVARTLTGKISLEEMR